MTSKYEYKFLMLVDGSNQCKNVSLADRLSCDDFENNGNSWQPMGYYLRYVNAK